MPTSRLKTGASIAPAALMHADDYTFGFHPDGVRNRDASGRRRFAIQTNRYAAVLDWEAATLVALGPIASPEPPDAAASASKELIDRLPPVAVTGTCVMDGRRFEVSGGPHDTDGVVIVRTGRFLQHVEIRDVRFRDAETGAEASFTGVFAVYCWPDRMSVALRAQGDAGDVSLSVEGAALPVSVNGDHAVFGDLAEPEGIIVGAGDQPTWYDGVAGWHEVRLGDHTDPFSPQTTTVELENTSGTRQDVRLHLSRVGGAWAPAGITGMCPVLRDADGNPIGLPVQASKNWHVDPNWFSGLTMISLDAGERVELEFTIAYGFWGGVPGVSHAQLCLEGWGGHQQWDQMALGAFGESICYDPDVGLGRSMIDDVRPLMVWGSGDEPERRWGWTHNVGGGDFLVLRSGGARRHLARMRTLYSSYGPVLSDVTYAGETADGALQARVRARSWRADDCVRALYDLRYEVVGDAGVTGLDRVALFQMGADGYNATAPGRLAVGSADGLMERWTPETGAGSYQCRGVRLPGRTPWVAAYATRRPDYLPASDRGALANRGMIVRHWDARLGGRVVEQPCYSVIGTDSDTASVVVELSPPAGVLELLPGDHVDATVEFVIVPQRASEYYGPNEDLRAALERHPDSWELVHREAVGLDLDVVAREGAVEERLPIRVRAADGRRATFTIHGGVGWVPVVIAGAAGYGPFELRVDGERVEQSPDRDWWQADLDTASQSWDLAFTLPIADGRAATEVEWVLA